MNCTEAPFQGHTIKNIPFQIHRERSIYYHVAVITIC